MLHVIRRQAFSSGRGSTWWRAALPLHPAVRLVAAAMLLATVLMVPRLGEQSLWLDEAISVSVARLNWPQLWQGIYEEHLNMSLYYVVLHLWSSLGQSEFMVRSLSAIFALATLPVTYACGARLFGPRVGGLAVLLLAVNPFYLAYAQEARSYSLVLLCATVSSYVFVRGLERPGRTGWGWYILSSVLAVYAHFFAVLVVLAHTASLLCLRRGAVPWKRVGLSAIALLPFLLPVAVFIRSRGASEISWIAAPAALDLVKIFANMAGDPFLCLAYAGCCVLALRAAVRACSEAWGTLASWRYAFCCAWLFVPIMVAFAFSFLTPVFVPRYLVASLPALVLLVSVGVAQISRRRLYVATCTLLIALSGLGAWNDYRTAAKEDWRGATSHVVVQAKAGDGMLFYAPGTHVPFAYYLERLGVPSAFFDRLDLGAVPTLPLAFYERVVGQIPAGHTRLWLILSHHTNPRSGRDVRQHFIRTLLQRHYAITWDQEFTGIRVILYEQR